MAFENIASRAFNTPLLVEPSKAVAFAAGLGPRLMSGAEINFSGVSELAANPPAPSNKPFASILDNRVSERVRDGFEGKYRIRDGVAIVPVTGVLIHRGAWVGSYSGQTSYEGITSQVEMLADDPQVRGVAFEFDSFGGEVAGCFDCADAVRELSAIKPTAAFIAEHSYSAGYALASQCGQIILPRTGGVGSIGVVIMHVDYERAVEAAGITINLIHAGAHKVDGNPYQALPEDVRENLQATVESTRELFAETVAAGRGASLNSAGALATEAACFIGGDAIENGLADKIAPPRAAFEAFVDEVNGRVQKTIKSKSNKPKSETGKRSQKMKKPKTAGKPKLDADTENDASSETETNDENQDASTGQGEATSTETPKADAGGERARIKAILNHPEAAGRTDLANHLAFNTDVSPEAAADTMRVSAKSKVGGPLGEAMQSDSNTLDGDSGEEAADTGGMKDAMQRRYGTKTA